MTSTDQGMLPAFEGKDVIKSRLRITKAGDGLADALDLDPEALHLGDEKYYVIKTRITHVDHRLDPKTGQVFRVHTGETEEIAAIDGATAEQMIEEEQAALRARQRALAAARGEEELPLDDTDDTDNADAPVDGLVDPDGVGEQDGGVEDDFEYPRPDPQPVDPDGASAEVSKGPKSGATR